MDEADEGLIRFLMRDRHGTPFEHNSFRFHIRAPIFVAREWFRHRVGSFNEFSMRYAKATDDFYVPEPEDVRSPGRQARRLLVRAGRRRSSPSARARSCARSTSTRTRRTSASSRPASRASSRARVMPGRRVHGVLLDGERAGADELRLAAGRRDGAARDPPLRGRGRAVLRARRCRSRTPRSSRRTASRPRAGVRRQDDLRSARGWPASCRVDHPAVLVEVLELVGRGQAHDHVVARDVEGAARDDGLAALRQVEVVVAALRAASAGR